MPNHTVPEVSEPSAVAVDPCAAARCDLPAETAVPLRLGGQERQVRLCAAHAVRLGAGRAPVPA